MRTYTIKEFPRYSITNDGKIWSDISYKWLKPLTGRKYLYVDLYKNNQSFKKSVHCLVLETFIGLCPKGMQACHNNGIKTDNRLENLRWDTHSNNQRDRIKHGTSNCGKQINYGESNHFCRLTESDVKIIIYMWKTNLFTQGEIANIYNVKNNTVSMIVNRKRWKYLWKGG